MLLNSILDAVPIFYWLLFKMPTKMVRKMMAIQRNFLWGKVDGDRKVYWVKWKTMCLPRNKGGFRMRDIWLVNWILLVKWRWRLFQSENQLWKEVIVAKYGVNSINVKLEGLGTIWYCALNGGKI